MNNSQNGGKKGEMIDVFDRRRNEATTVHE